MLSPNTHLFQRRLHNQDDELFSGAATELFTLEKICSGNVQSTVLSILESLSALNRRLVIVRTRQIWEWEDEGSSY
jgi:hypothetical protein